MKNKLIQLCLLLLLGITSCDKTETPTAGSGAVCVYNQAYQEGKCVDDFADIVANANGCYVLIDPFDETDGKPNHERIAEIKKKNNSVCGYISIGTGEGWRTDSPQVIPFYCVSIERQEWEREYFVDRADPGLIRLMKDRIDKLKKWGCDWVEFDNMDWAFDDEARNEYGFKISERECIDYYNELARYADSLGLKCLAKNPLKNREVDGFDGALFESHPKVDPSWSTADAKFFHDADKLTIINHYREGKCNKTYSEFLKSIGKNVSFICQKRKGCYDHFNN